MEENVMQLHENIWLHKRFKGPARYWSIYIAYTSSISTVSGPTMANFVLEVFLMVF